MTEDGSSPTLDYFDALWGGLLIGPVSYLLVLGNSDIPLKEKTYYFTILLYGLISAVSAQKAVHDRMVGIPVTNIYLGLCWLAVGLSTLLLAISLSNAPLAMTEKGFYAMSYILSLFGLWPCRKRWVRLF